MTSGEKPRDLSLRGSMQMQSSYLLPEPEVLGEGIDNQLPEVTEKSCLQQAQR